MANKNLLRASIVAAVLALPLFVQSAAFADRDDHRNNHGNRYAYGQPNHGTWERDHRRFDRDDRHRFDRDDRHRFDRDDRHHFDRDARHDHH